MKRGKKYVEAAKAVDRATLYDAPEAISLVKKAAVAKFDETIEVHIRTGCDGRHADQQIRGAVVLPHGTGKKVRVLVFAKDAKAEEAKAAGADFVGAEDLRQDLIFIFTIPRSILQTVRTTTSISRNTDRNMILEIRKAICSAWSRKK